MVDIMGWALAVLWVGKYFLCRSHGSPVLDGILSVVILVTLIAAAIRIFRILNNE